MQPGLYDDVHAALHAARVRYVVVGGTAVVLQGHARMTLDLDLVIDLAEPQARAAMAAITSTGMLPRLPVAAEDFADAELRRDWHENRNLLVFSFYDPASPLREVDVFVEEPVPFDELYDEADVVRIGEVPVRVASVRHLIHMKTEAGRPVDLQDVAVLREISGER
ncbi:MAG TPA: hypothetical protein VNU26_14995 [Mycobacteriales bacterium]|nr:hypothetical protein [Mycobacteriales bacterium]